MEIALIIISTFTLFLVVLLLLRVLSSRPSDIKNQVDSISRAQERTEQYLREEIGHNREELLAQLRGFNDSILKTISDNAGSQNTRLESLVKSNEERMERLENKVEQKLLRLQEDNARRLEEMRKTVDEKLQGTLEKRLGDSFKMVGERLEQVHKGLGEMQSLANGVGDLKKVLANVKTRGTWGEIQLGNLLDQILTPDQYARNVQTKESSDQRVEFAICLPGKDEMEDKDVWLPIDAKYPREDYERLIDASERGDQAAVDAAAKSIEQRIKGEAKQIRDKYLNPPYTTDFGIMFLPIEGLYGEVLRRPGLVEHLQREYRVNIAGPTNLAALLNSLQMGFRTLAIQKRTSEVWSLLGAVKTQFGKFEEVINKVQKKLNEASDVIESDVARRTRAIERRLRSVDSLSATETDKLLNSGTEEEEETS
jgi:DNA recombination protein RmuC